MAVPTQHFPGQLIPLVMCHTYSVNFPQIQMEMLTTLQMMYRGGQKGWMLGRNFPESIMFGRKFSAIERCFDTIR